MTKIQEMKTVYVVGGDPAVEKMFEKKGFIPTGPNGLYLETHEPDLICFTGGADISPYLYGEEPDGARGCDPIRDEFEKQVYEKYVGEAPFVGICRGGQLLNVLNGGKLVQDHGLISGYVSMWELFEQDGIEHKVFVDHHQGILPTEEAVGFIHGPDIPSGEHIAYACFYPKTRSLCFQPHPEWGHKETENIFFDLVKECLKL